MVNIMNIITKVDEVKNKYDAIYFIQSIQEKYVNNLITFGDMMEDATELIRHINNPAFDISELKRIEATKLVYSSMACTMHF